jgi:hypothetical protein
MPHLLPDKPKEEPAMSSENAFNLHVRTLSADKVRFFAERCGLSNAEVLTRMIDYACAHASLKPRPVYELAFDNGDDPIRFGRKAK